MATKRHWPSRRVIARRRFLALAGTALVAMAAGFFGWRRAARPIQESATPPVDETPSQDETSSHDETPRPFTVALLSDPHTEGPSSPTHPSINGKLIDTLADLKEAKPNAWLCCGDVSNHGYAEEFEAFKKIMVDAGGAGPLMVTTGNHEFYDTEADDAEALRRFCAAFGQEKPYSNHVVEGIHFVMMADEQWSSAPYNPEWAWLSQEQLSWFEQILAEHKDLFTVVCLHQPVQESVLWSHGGNDFGGTGQAAELRAILQRNPQVRLWLSGHTHQRLDQNGQRVKQGETTFLALGSTFYLFEGPNGQHKEFGSSQSRVMEIWADKVVVKTRDHITKQWLADLEFSLPRTL